MPPRTKTRTVAPPVTATEVAVLGLLAEGERSGYDLLREAERSVGFFWTPAKTQLYAVLRKLVENGFATSRLVRQYDLDITGIRGTGSRSAPDASGCSAPFAVAPPDAARRIVCQ